VAPATPKGISNNRTALIAALFLRTEHLRVAAVCDTHY
jgi:hypothetical protein